MSVATLQQIRQDLPAWMALVQRGETAAILDDGREVARLVPPADHPAPAARALARFRRAPPGRVW